MQRKQAVTLPRAVLESASTGVAAAVALACAAVSGSGVQVREARSPGCRRINSCATPALPPLPPPCCQTRPCRYRPPLQAVHAAAQGLVGQEKNITGTTHAVDSLQPLLDRLAAAQQGIRANCQQLPAVQQAAKQAVAAGSSPQQQQQQQQQDGERGCRSRDSSR